MRVCISMRGRVHPSHYGPHQPRIQTEVLGHSLVRSLFRSHHSLVRLLRTTRFIHALRCAHSFIRLLILLTPSLACSLRSLACSWESECIRWLFYLCFSLIWPIVHPSVCRSACPVEFLNAKKTMMQISDDEVIASDVPRVSFFLDSPRFCGTFDYGSSGTCNYGSRRPHVPPAWWYRQKFPYLLKSTPPLFVIERLICKLKKETYILDSLLMIAMIASRISCHEYKKIRFGNETSSFSLS